MKLLSISKEGANILQIFSKRSDNFSLFLCKKLLGDDIDQLSRDGFDWVIGKVTFKVRKVLFTPLKLIRTHNRKSSVYFKTLNFYDL